MGSKASSPKMPRQPAQRLTADNTQQQDAEKKRRMSGGTGSTDLFNLSAKTQATNSQTSLFNTAGTGTKQTIG